MKTKKLTWSDIQAVEVGFFENIQENVSKGVSAIVESPIKVVGMTPTTFYFYINEHAHSAEWKIDNDKLSIKNIEKLNIDEASIGKQYDIAVSQLVDAIEHGGDVTNEWNQVVEVCKVQLSGHKKLRKDRTVKKHAKKTVSEQKVHSVKIKAVIKESIEKLSRLIDDFFGSAEETEYTYDLKEEKIIQNNVPIKPIIRNIEEARNSALKLEWRDYVKDKVKFLDINEEVYMLTKQEISERLSKIAQHSFDLDEGDVARETQMIMERREQNASTLKNIFAPFIVVENKDIDTIILEAQQVFDTDKKNFMEELTQILQEIFVTVEQESKDDDTKEKARRFNEKLQKEVMSGEGVDKDILAELAKSAVELAGTLEGLDDTSSIDKDELMNQPAVDIDATTKTPAQKQPFEEDVDADAEELATMDAINPDELEEVEEDWVELHCDACNADFKVDMNKVRTIQSTQDSGDIESPEDLEDKEDAGALDIADANVTTDNECVEVNCPYCESKVPACDDDSVSIEKALADVMTPDVEEGSPAIDPNYFGTKIDEQSPSADYEYNHKAHSSGAGVNKGVAGTKGGFNTNPPQTKVDDKGDGESISARRDGKSFRMLDNTSAKADDKGEGEAINTKSGKSFVKGGDSATKKDDKASAEDGVLGKSGTGFKSGGASITKKDDKAVGEPIVDKGKQGGSGFVKGGMSTNKATDKPKVNESKRMKRMKRKR